MSDNHDTLDVILSGVTTVLTAIAVLFLWFILALAALRITGVW